MGDKFFDENMNPISFGEMIEEDRRKVAEEIINELESNPNEDDSISPNIQHWIEQKKIQLRKKYRLNSPPHPLREEKLYPKIK